MPQLFEVADHCQHGENCLNHHPVVPLSPWTNLQVCGVACFGMKLTVCQDNHPLLKLTNQRLKGGVMDIGSRTVPSTYQAPLIEQQAEFTADNPTMIRLALFANLSGAATFSNRMNLTIVP